MLTSIIHKRMPSEVGSCSQRFEIQLDGLGSSGGTANLV